MLGSTFEMESLDDNDANDISFDFPVSTKIEPSQSQIQAEGMDLDQIEVPYAIEKQQIIPLVEANTPALSETQNTFHQSSDSTFPASSTMLSPPAKREQPISYAREFSKPRMTDMEKKLPLIRVMKEEGSQSQTHKPFLTPKGERYFLHALFHLIDYSKRTSPLRLCYHCFSVRHKDFRKPNDVKFISTGLLEMFEGLDGSNSTESEEKRLRERWNRMLCQSGGFLEELGMIRRVPVLPGEPEWVDLDKEAVDADDIHGGYKVERSEFKKKLDVEKGLGDGHGWILGINERVEYRLPSFGRCTGVHKDGSRCKYRSYYRISDDLDGRGDSIVGQGKKLSLFDSVLEQSNQQAEIQTEEDSFITGAYTVKDVVRQIADNSYTTPIGLREERRREKLRLQEAEQTIKARQRKMEMFNKQNEGYHEASTSKPVHKNLISSSHHDPNQFNPDLEEDHLGAQDPETMSVSMSISVKGMKEAPQVNLDNRSEIGRQQKMQNDDLIQKNLKKMRKLSKKLKKSKMMGQQSMAMQNSGFGTENGGSEYHDPMEKQFAQYQSQYTQNQMYAQASAQSYPGYPPYYGYYPEMGATQGYEHLGKRYPPDYRQNSENPGKMASSSSYQTSVRHSAYPTSSQCGPEAYHYEDQGFSQHSVRSSVQTSGQTSSSVPVVPDEFKALELLGISLQTTSEVKQQTQSQANKKKGAALFKDFEE